MESIAILAIVMSTIAIIMSGLTLFVVVSFTNTVKINQASVANQINELLVKLGAKSA